jgi:type I restriction enzyme R subunit
LDQADISYFDPAAHWSVVERGLPHWSQSGCVSFVTWRLNDSLPVEVLARMDREVEALLTTEGIDPVGNWKQQLAQQASKRRGEIQWKQFATRDKFLDQGFGSCALADARCSMTVFDSLRKFDMDRYFLTDVVVMPNHCHFLCAFADESRFLKQCTDWKRYTGRQINQTLGRSGEFWQVDQFDHLIRSPEQFDHYRRYIAKNPLESRLPEGSFLHFQKQLM